MSWLFAFLEWIKDPENSNAVRGVTALIGIPGALWGGYLFWQALRGRSLVQRIEELDQKNAELLTEKTIVRKELEDLRGKSAEILSANASTKERLDESLKILAELKNAHKSALDQNSELARQLLDVVNEIRALNQDRLRSLGVASDATKTLRASMRNKDELNAAHVSELLSFAFEQMRSVEASLTNNSNRDGRLDELISRSLDAISQHRKTIHQARRWGIKNQSG